MGQSQLINKNLVVLRWLTMRIEDFFLSFRVREIDKHSRYVPFLNAMGFEMVCKGYLALPSFPWVLVPRVFSEMPFGKSPPLCKGRIKVG
jgi:hypothetical protein